MRPTDLGGLGHSFAEDLDLDVAGVGVKLPVRRISSDQPVPGKGLLTVTDMAAERWA
jgi:hypothetical protein